MPHSLGKGFILAPYPKALKTHQVSSMKAIGMSIGITISCLLGACANRSEFGCVPVPYHITLSPTAPESDGFTLVRIATSGNVTIRGAGDSRLTARIGETFQDIDNPEKNSGLVLKSVDLESGEVVLETTMFVMTVE
ncbi:MAG: hypothetical protein H7A52_04420 [Akkermansiaceae bacterium]|nr:hypothetical protein [Akkermansiaceae bacterium]